jgi:hypothetical protein
MIKKYFFKRNNPNCVMRGVTQNKARQDAAV